MRLVDALSMLDPERLDALAERHGVEIDPKKRISRAEQVARAMADLPERYDVRGFPSEVQAALGALVARPAGLARRELGGAALALVRADLAFVGDDDRVFIPGAFRVALPPSADDPALAPRLLLGELDEDLVHALSGRHAPRRVLPRALVLDEVLEALESEASVERMVKALSPEAKRLIRAIEARGGLVPTEELLTIAREPGRYATTTFAVLPKRGPAWELAESGLVLPSGRDAWAVPWTVAEVVGKKRREEARAARARIVARAREEDLVPTRAELGRDPAPTAVALLALLESGGARMRGVTGAPKSAVDRAQKKLHVDGRHAEMLISLARASQLASRSFALRDVGAALFSTWRAGGAWDEARDPHDTHRVGRRFSLLPGPSPILRRALLEVLGELPPHAFALREEVIAATLADLAATGAKAALARAKARRADSFRTALDVVLARMLDDSLPALGALDRGQSGEGAVVRLSAHGRAWLDGEEIVSAGGASSAEASVWMAPRRLAVGGAAGVRALHLAALAAEPIVADGVLVLLYEESSIENAVTRGHPVETVVGALAELAGEVDEETLSLLEAARKARPECVVVPSGGLLVVGDEALRARLHDADRAEAIFLPTAVEGGLLLREGVTTAEVARLLREHGAILRRRR